MNNDYFEPQNLCLIVGPTGSGKTYGFLNTLRQTKKSTFNQEIYNVVIICSTIDSHDNRELYSNRNLQETFPNVENILKIPLGKLNVNLLRRVKTWLTEKAQIKPEQEVNVPLLNAQGKKIMTEKMLDDEEPIHENIINPLGQQADFVMVDVNVPSEKPPQEEQEPEYVYRPTLVIMDDVDFKNNDSTVLEFVGRNIHHQNLFLVWLKQSFQGVGYKFLFGQVTYVGFPTFRPANTTFFRELLLRRGHLDTNGALTTKQLNQAVKQFYYDTINKAKKMHINMIWLNFKQNSNFGFDFITRFPTFYDVRDQPVGNDRPQTSQTTTYGARDPIRENL